MVQEPTQDRNVPFEVIKEEEQEEFEKQKDQENHDDPENGEEQPAIIFFTPKQLEVLLKMNRLNFTELITTLKGAWECVSNILLYSKQIKSLN